MPSLPARITRKALRTLRRVARPDAAESPRPPAESDTFEPTPPGACGPDDVARWNTEWLRYLGREWEIQLRPHTDYPLTPELPAEAIDVVDICLAPNRPLHLYADRDALAGCTVMELGCGCGNMGKLLGRYVDTYLGVDYSTMAQAIARLVSPDNCHYVHVADEAGLAEWRGRIDTVVGRHFWIHQNRQLAKWNLEFLRPFLKPGGRLYADFFWRDPDATHGKIFTPLDPLSKAYPSATFEYDEGAVEDLVDGTGFEIQRQEISRAMQRRYVVLARSD